MALIERQSDHRQMMERRALLWEFIRSMAGIVAGLIITLAFLGVCAWLIYNGHDMAGTVLGSVDLVALVSLFVLGQRTVANERIKKQQIMAQQLPPSPRR